MIDIERARQAKEALDTFVAPALAQIRETYLKRLVEVSAGENNPKVRAGKQHSLSVALKITDQVEGILKGIIMDGELAAHKLDREARVTEMTAAQRRVLGIAAY